MSSACIFWFPIFCCCFYRVFVCVCVFLGFVSLWVCLLKRRKRGRGFGVGQEDLGREKCDGGGVEGVAARGELILRKLEGKSTPCAVGSQASQVLTGSFGCSGVCLQDLGWGLSHQLISPNSDRRLHQHGGDRRCSCWRGLASSAGGSRLVHTPKVSHSSSRAPQGLVGRRKAEPQAGQGYLT